MNFERTDDPALLMPKIGNVHGALLRLGFAFYSAKRVHFYRQFVPLFEGGVKAQFVARNISHVSIVIMLDEADEHGRCWIKYGYPQMVPHRNKIVDTFKPLTSEETYLTINVYPDRELREFEKTFSDVINRLKTQKIDMEMDCDSEEGLTKKSINPWEAVVYAVQQSLCSERVRMTGQWFVEDIGPHPIQPEVFIEPASKRSRLPNFDRSARPRLDRRRDVRRFVRRPVHVHR